MVKSYDAGGPGLPGFAVMRPIPAGGGIIDDYR